jgi:hypothetical protein
LLNRHPAAAFRARAGLRAPVSGGTSDMQVVADFNGGSSDEHQD